MSIAQLRSKAQKALLDGKHKKALDLFAQLHKEDPDDLRVHVKVAELREKVNDTAGAVRDYIEIAKIYSDKGFVVQAIAINKIILRLDPSQTQIKDRLKDLSDERGDDWAISTITHTDLKAADFSDKDRTKLGFERTPLLSGLSGEELEEFMDSLQLKNVTADEYIYREGDPGNFLYLIGMGHVLLEARDAAGKKRRYSRLVEGDFFGEHAFMARSKHAEAAMAGSDCNILIIERSIFDAWVEKYPSIQSTVEDFYRQRVLARVLAITPVFEGVPEDARGALADRFHLHTFEDGDEIVREGTTGDTFYLIRSGRVDVSTSTMADKKELISLGSMGEGDFFGEVALLTDKPRTATVTAKGSVELMELTRGDFDEIVEKYPSVFKVVERYQKKRVQDTIRALLSRKSG